MRSTTIVRKELLKSEINKNNKIEQKNLKITDILFQIF
jgi:hypothetical protein